MEHGLASSNMQVIVDSIIEEDFRYRMMKENEIDSLLSCDLSIEEGKAVYQYMISSYEPMETYYEHNVLDLTSLCWLFQGIIKGVRQGKEYFLEESGYLIDAKYLFIDSSLGQVKCCYCPQIQGILREQLLAIIEYCMNRINYQEETVVRVTYQLYQLVRQEATTLQQIEAYIMEQGNQNKVREFPSPEVGTWNLHSEQIESKENACFIPKEPPVQFAESIPEDMKKKRQSNSYVLIAIVAVVDIILFWYLYCSGIFHTKLGYQFDLMKYVSVVGIIVVVESYIGWKKRAFIVGKKQDIPSNNFEGFEFHPIVTQVDVPISEENIPYRVTGEAIKTEIPKDEFCFSKIQLMPKKEEKELELMVVKFPYVIGKEKDKVDGIITSRLASRKHAKITCQKNQIYIEDLGSTNGTYVNEHKIIDHSMVPLFPGDEVRFADISYHVMVS